MNDHKGILMTMLDLWPEGSANRAALVAGIDGLEADILQLKRRIFEASTMAANQGRLESALRTFVRLAKRDPALLRGGVLFEQPWPTLEKAVLAAEAVLADAKRRVMEEVAVQRGDA